MDLESIPSMGVGSTPTKPTKDIRLIEAKNELLQVFYKLKIIYPDIISVGTPFYIQKRQRIVTKIIFSDKSTKAIQIGKLVYEAEIGRRLLTNETVDHVDGNPMNNKIYNLQLLDRIENCKKGPSLEVKNKKSKDASVRMLGVPNLNTTGILNGMVKLSEEQVMEIKQLQLIHYRGQDNQLAIKYGVRREIIRDIRFNKIWKHISI